MTRTSRLTKIEKLDHDYPGLADQLREWFAQGVAVRQVPRLVFAKYNLRITEAPVASFRSRRWARERELLLDRRIDALLARLSAREDEIALALAAQMRGLPN
jgi:hypothetical protein